MSKSKAGSGGLKTFFLYNIEKLILGVSLILLGLFFYLGLSSEKFDKSPDRLVQEANQATSYIEQDSNWKNIESYRHGDVEVVDRVEQASTPVDPSEYKITGLSIVPKALQLRMDPPLPEIKEAEAHVLRAAVIVQNKQKNSSDPILMLPLARPKVDAGAKNRFPSGRMNMDELDDDDMGDSMGGGPPSRGGNRGRTELEKDPQEDAEVDAWWGMPGVLAVTRGGVRPKNVATATDMALTRNIVVVNALIEHKSLWKVFEQTLSSSLGYFPKRDLPRYDFLQVERREVKNGQPTEWKDISPWVNFDQANLYPSSFTSAPEVVPPENYDQFLTNAIPPIVGVDYTQSVIHSKLNKRVFKVPEEETGVATSAILAGEREENADERMMRNRDGTGMRRQKKGLSGNSGMGGMNGMGGGFYEGGRDGMGNGMNGRNAGDGRSSSDLTEYVELSDITVEPISDYKQIRFFDMSVTPNASAIYEYRMRVWLADPNNADEKMVSAMQDDGMDGMGGMNGMRGPKGEEKKIFKKTKINFTMQDQTVRNRLKLAREAGDVGEKEYYVSEIYDDADKPVEIKIPKGEEYLRYDRPTKWSDPIRVAVKGAVSEFYAEKIDEPRTARVGSVEIPVDEMKAEIVTSVESSDYQGAFVAAKRSFAVGDLLNFNEPVTIMHPVAQSIHFVEDFNFRSNGVLIDIMGGERLDVSRNDPMQYELPGETLIMDADGEFEISNDIDDLESARQALRLPDERAEFGGKKAARRAEEEKMEMMNGGRGGRNGRGGR